MKDLLLSFRLIKYGNKVKMLMTSGLCFFVVGFLLEIVNKGGNPIGMVYLGIIVGTMIQSAISLEAAEFFLASPKMKKLQTSAPAGMYLVMLTAIEILCIAIKAYMIKYQGLDEYTASATILFGAFFITLTTIYYSVACKYMLVSSIIYVGVGCPLLMFFQKADSLIIFQKLFSIGFWPAAGLSYAIMLLGIAIFYGVSNLLYKKPFSKYALKGVFDSTAR